MRRRSLYRVVLLLGIGLLGKVGLAWGQKGEPPAPADVAPSAPVVPSAPASRGSSLSVEVVAAETTASGQPLTFEIVVRNPGSTPATGVRVEQAVPPSCRVLQSEPRGESQSDRVTWNLGSLEGGGERRLKVEMLLGENGDGPPAPTVSFAPAVAHRTRIIGPSLTPLAVTMTGPESAQRGDKVKFQIQIVNNGTAPIQHVLVRDQLPDGLHLPQGSYVETDIGTLRAGESKTLPLEVTAMRAGTWDNVVRVLADSDLKAESKASMTVVEPALTLRLLGPRQTAPGDIDLMLEVGNPGTNPANGIRLTQIVPAGLDVVAASSGGSLDAANRAVVWSMGNLAAGQKQTISLKVKAKGPGDWKLAAQAVGDQLGEAKASLELRVEATSLLHIDLAAHDNSLAADAETTYEIHAVNQGSAAATSAQLTVGLPEGLTLVNAEGPTAARPSPRGVAFDPLPRLAPRADAVYRVRLRGQQPGDWRFRIELSADGASKPLLDEVGVRVIGAPGTPRQTIATTR